MDDSSHRAPNADQRLDQISTQWSLLRLAHHDASSAGQARERMVLRYAPAVRSYIGALVREEHEADEIAQDVIVRLLKGDFGRASPERGRFRDLLKVAVKNMVRTHWQRQQRRGKRNVAVEQRATSAPTDEAGDAHWLSAWRNSLLEVAWRALEHFQQSTPGNSAYTLLRLRADFPDDDTSALAARLEQATGLSCRSDAVRQQLRRARLRFAQLLIEETARSLGTSTPAQVEEELADLALLEYVQDFLPPDWRDKGELR